MKILFTSSEKQQIMNIAFALDRMGHEVGMYPTPSEVIGGDEEEEKRLKVFLKENHVDFVISNVYAPVIAQITYELEIKYAIYGMDSPMYDIYISVFPHYDNCYFFYFDRREYQMALHKGYSNIYYLPLAGDVAWAENLVITDEEIKKYSCDMSFVGSLYTDNFYDRYIGNLPYEAQMACSEIMEKSAFLWDGLDRISEFLTPELLQSIKNIFPNSYEAYQLSDKYYFKEAFFARKLTNIERTLLLELLSERYGLHLYTRAAEKVPDGIRRFPGVSPMTDALKVYYASRININITMRSIESGVPLRIFDIMSVGGFVLSNYQEEIPELFEEGKEIVTFQTPEEMIEKADYYLTHETERMRIGINGYEKVKNCYTYEHQLGKIISILFSAL